MAEWIGSALAAVLGTAAVFAAATGLYRRLRLFILNPVLVSILGVVGLLWALGVSYETYDRGGRLLTFLLGPAVVALGLPLHQQTPELLRRGRAILLSLMAGSVVGILSATLLAVWAGASPEVVRSLAPRSVTTPIAIEISERLGGLPSLSAVMVIATGVLGAVVGPSLLRLLRVDTPAAFGLAMGASAHGIGTARAAEEGMAEAASGGLAIGLMGVATALLAPLLLLLLESLGLIAR